MRIAVVCTIFPSLSQTFVIDQICGLIDLGHEVDIFAVREGVEHVTNPLVDRYNLLSRTRFAPSFPQGRLGRVARVAQLLTTCLIRAPGAMPRILRNSAPMAIRRRDALAAAVQFVNSPGYDAVLCHFGPMGNRAIHVRAMGLLKGPVATVFHGSDISRYVDHAGPKVYRRLFKEGDSFLPISASWRDRLVELGCPADRILVHRMGVDCGNWHFVPRARAAEEPTKLISVCRLVEKKGIEYALRACAEVMKKHPNTQVQYTIIGDGPLSTRLQQLASDLDVQHAVTFAGAQPPNVVAEMLTKAHILVAPSVTAADGDKEGIPVAIMEAMAQGMPILSTYHSGIPELVQDGASGYLAPERNVGVLAENLEKLLLAPESWTTLGHTGRAVVERQHDNAKLLAQLDEHLRSLSQPNEALT